MQSSWALHGHVLCGGCGLPCLAGGHRRPCGASDWNGEPMVRAARGVGSLWPSALMPLSRNGSCEGPEAPCCEGCCSWKVTHTKGGILWGTVAVGTLHQGEDLSEEQWLWAHWAGNIKTWRGDGKTVRRKEQQVGPLPCNPKPLPHPLAWQGSGTGWL